jgi:hypothetical protein
MYRRALITGATSGIGAAFARVLPVETSLLLTGRHAERLREIAEQLGSPERPVDCVAADLTTEAGRAAVIEQARRFRIDLLICNAGRGVHGAFVEKPPLADLSTVALNIEATVTLLRALLPEMLAVAREENRRAGVIVVSSMVVFGPVPAGMICYAASKTFGLRLTEGLAAELRHEPVDVLALCPDSTATEFFDRAGLPLPPGAAPPETVAREGLTALGRRTVHHCGRRYQPLALLLTRNPALDVRKLPGKIMAKLQHASPSFARHRPD